eukprot:4444111-Pleurochrysis_carterae.AAC.1
MSLHSAESSLAAVPKRSAPSRAWSRRRCRTSTQAPRRPGRRYESRNLETSAVQRASPGYRSPARR